MQCHKPGHRSPARCVSALLAAGALLATVADQVGGSSERPVVRTAALEVTASEKPDAAGGPGRPSPAPAARLLPPARKARPAGTHQTQSTTKQSKAKQSASSTRSITRARPAPVKTSSISYLLAHLPAAKNAKAAKAVKLALSLRGIPYKWGGTSRSGFDCSGFTQYVWAQAGVKIPRTVREQAKAGTHISLRNAEPGDLVVFYPNQQHVGVYVGNGLVIDSPHPGSSVRPDLVSTMPVSVVVRLRS